MITAEPTTDILVEGCVTIIFEFNKFHTQVDFRLLTVVDINDLGLGFNFYGLAIDDYFEKNSENLSDIGGVFGEDIETTYGYVFNFSINNITIALDNANSNVYADSGVLPAVFCIVFAHFIRHPGVFILIN